MVLGQSGTFHEQHPGQKSPSAVLQPTSLNNDGSEPALGLAVASVGLIPALLGCGAGWKQMGPTMGLRMGAMANVGDAIRMALSAHACPGVLARPRVQSWVSLGSVQDLHGDVP